jgi:hypothetical protein
MKTAVFWDVSPCGLVEFTDVSVVLTASIIRAMGCASCLRRQVKLRGQYVFWNLYMREQFSPSNSWKTPNLFSLIYQNSKRIFNFLCKVIEDGVLQFVSSRDRLIRVIETVGI